jgi:peptidoglycan-N-acetylglucosamine deacetylase
MPAARIALWVASIAGLALLVRSLVIAPVPFWIAVTALVLYVTYSTLGVIVPQLEMYADVLWKGDPASRAVALTFDDGPHPVTTRRVLEALDQAGARATFFVVGRKVEQYPDVVREINARGHAIGLHGFEHNRLFTLKAPSYVLDDIRRTQEAVERACGLRPTLFRPPIGYITPRTALGAKRAGVSIVAWSARALDGLGQTDVDRVVRRVERKLEPGAIVMLHDASERETFEPATVEALPRILTAIKERGLETVTVPEMLEQPQTERGQVAQRLL